MQSRQSLGCKHTLKIIRSEINLLYARHAKSIEISQTGPDFKGFFCVRIYAYFTLSVISLFQQFG